MGLSFSIKPQIGSKYFLKSPFWGNFHEISIFESQNAIIRAILTCVSSYLLQIILWWFLDDSMKKWCITKLSYRNLSISWPQIENTGKKGLAQQILLHNGLKSYLLGEFIVSFPPLFLTKVFFQSMSISVKSHNNTIALN